MFKTIKYGSILVLLLILYLSNGTHETFAAAETQLLTRPWRIRARYGAVERYQLIDPNTLKGNNALRLTFDLKGTCLEDGDASAIIFDQPINRTWRYISLFRYGKKCYNGFQTIDIPLSDFKGLDPSKPVGTFHTRIWGRRPYDIEINSAILVNIPAYSIGLQTTFGNILNSPTPSQIPTPIPSKTPTPSPTLTISPSIFVQINIQIPTNTPVPTNTLVPTIPPTTTPPPTIAPQPSATPVPTPSTRASWSIQSVSSMKETKDRVCYQRSGDFIANWLNKAVEIGANYISIETPYENPLCGDSLEYTRIWVSKTRDRGLKVWHRHMPLAFEGIYNSSKNSEIDYLKLIANYIINNASLFAEGDIFTPIPEPQNGGIAGVTYCAQGVCIFRNAFEFNLWLRNAIDISERAFNSIGLGGKIKIGYYGFDGFVAWGHNNPDWDGILEDETVSKMGNITIDHYPEIVGTNMAQDLDELEARYPNIPIIIGEWGTITGGDTEQQVRNSMQAARRPSVVGFNYWHFGVGGNEELISEDFSIKKQFDEVQGFFKQL